MNANAPAKPADWHLLESSEVLARLQVDPAQGLSSAEVEARRQSHGWNELVEHAGAGALAMFLAQFKGVMVLVLLAAAVISGLLGEHLDALVILAIVIINAVLGFVQEYRAEQAMAALKRMATPSARVRREGKTQTVPSRELVPGDIILVEAGDAISADSRLIKVANLRVQEASLTGESEPVSKHAHGLTGSDIPLGDRRNMLYFGTSASYGNGQAVVVTTGMQTELGRIAELIQGVAQEQTPLQRRMEYLGKTLAVVALVIIVLVFVLGLLRGDEPVELFLTSVAMAVAAIPEGLPAVVTIALALGARRMLDRKALIRKLPAVETLGSVTVICSDKTGTLTQNQMTVKVLDIANNQIVLEGREHRDVPMFQVVSGEGDPVTLRLMLAGSSLCNDAIIEPRPDVPDKFDIMGDPTEAAILIAAQQYGLTKVELDARFPRIAEIPFSSDRKRMTTVHQVSREGIMEVDPQAVSIYDQYGYRYASFTKGALDVLLEITPRVWVRDHDEPIDDEWRTRIRETHDRLAGQGLRILGLSMRFFSQPPDETAGETALEALEEDLIFVGMMGMIDPPRPEVKEAVARCKTAGIRPIMITGDHPLTAKQIARELDIAQPGDRIVTGRELDSLSQTELEQVVLEAPVFARVSPEHKLNIVQALQKQGHIVAMTGDGVNDAPALRKAEIGVAMGITGTDVSKEAADMVILDDNFATIVRAVEEGRTIYDNVRKFMQYIMTSNSGEIYVMLLAPFLGLPLPLVPLQILWINLVTDGLPGLALSVEASEKDIMRRPPFAPNESIFSRGIGPRILWVGLLMGIISLGVGWWAYQIDPTNEGWWRTLVFNTLTVSQMANVMALRANRESVFVTGLFANRALVGAVALTFLLQLAVIYIPFMQTIFRTTALSAADFALTVALSTIIFVAVELEKWVRRRWQA